MTTKRLFLLLASLMAMSLVFLLPKQLQFQPVGVKLLDTLALGGMSMRTVSSFFR